MPHDRTMVPPAGFARCAQTAFYDLAEAPSAMEDMLSRKIQGKAMIVTPAFRAKFGADGGGGRVGRL